MHSGNITLSDNNKVATKTGGGSTWNAAVMTKQKQPSFRVRIVNGVNIMLGFASRSNFQLNETNYPSRGWYLHIADGTLYSQQGDSGRGYAGALPPGSIIAASFDPAAHTISFTLVADSLQLGAAFRNLPTMELYPAVEIREVGQAVELL